MAFDRKAYMKEYTKKYYKQNKAKLDARVRKWQEDHPEKVKEFARKHRRDNAAALKLKRKDENQRGCIRNYRQSSVEAFLLKKFYQIKKKGKMVDKKGDLIARYKAEVTMAYLLSLWEKQGGKCAITKKSMIYSFGSPFTVSIDRIDSNVGYVEGNIQLVCQAINFAKNKYSSAEFLYFWANDSLSTDRPDPRLKQHLCPEPLCLSDDPSPSDAETKYKT